MGRQTLRIHVSLTPFGSLSEVILLDDLDSTLEQAVGLIRELMLNALCYRCWTSVDMDLRSR